MRNRNNREGGVGNSEPAFHQPEGNVKSDTTTKAGGEAAVGFPEAPEGSTVGGGGDRNQKILIGLAAAILGIMVLAVAFGLGYYMGSQKADVERIAVPGRTGTRDRAAVQPLLPTGPPGGEQGTQSPGDGFRRMMQEEGSEVAGGRVVSVDGSRVTVEDGGEETVVELTPDTVAFGGESEGPGYEVAFGLEEGDRAVFLVRKQEDGSLVAVAVRLGAGHADRPEIPASSASFSISS